MGDNLKTNNFDIDVNIVTKSKNAGTTASAPSSKNETIVVDLSYSSKQSEIDLLLKSPEFLKLSKEEQIAELIKRFPSVKPDVIKFLLKDVPSNTVVEMTEPIKQKNITKEQISFQKFLNGKVKNKKEQQQILGAAVKNLDELIPKEYFQSSAWKELSPTEKLEKRMDALLATQIPGYAKNPNPQMREMLKDQIGQLIDPNWNSKSDIEKQQLFQLVALAAEVSENNDLTLLEIAQKMQTKDGKKEVDVMFQNFAVEQFDKILNSNLIDVNSEEWKNKSDSDKVKAFADIIINNIDPNLNVSLSKEQKEELIEIWEKQLGEMLFDTKFVTNEQQICERVFVTEIEALMSHNQDNPDNKISLKDFKDKVEVRTELLNEASEKNEIELAPWEKGIREVFMSYNKDMRTNKDVFTKGEVLKYLQSKEQLTDNEQALLKSLLISKSLVSKNNGNNLKKWEESPLRDSVYGADYEIRTKYKYDSLTKNPKYSQLILNVCKEYGLSKEALELPDNFASLTPEEQANVLREVRYNQYLIRTKCFIHDYIDTHNKKFPDNQWDENNLNLEAKKEILSMMYDGTNARQFGKAKIALNITPEEYDMIVDDINYSFIQARSTLEENAYSEATEANIQSKNITLVDMATDVVADCAKSEDESVQQQGQKIQNVGLKSENGDYLTTKIPEALVEAGVEPDIISKFDNYAINDEEISIGKRNKYHDKTMELAPNDETRKYYTEQAAQNAKSADTLEIVAAGTKHIKDETIKTESQKVVVDTATQKFPDEAPRVQEAAKTGQVSAETLAKPPVKPATDDSKTQSAKNDEAKPADKQQPKADNASDTKANQPKTQQTQQAGQQAQTPAKNQQTSAATANTTTASHNEVQQNFGTPANSGNVSTPAGSVGQSATQSYSEQVIVPTPVQNASATSNICVVAGGNASQVQAFDGVPATNGSSQIVGDTTQPAVDSSVQVYSDNTVSDNQVLGSENASAKVQDNQAVTSEGQEVQSDEVENTNAATSANVPAQNPATSNEATALAVKTKEELLNKIDQMIQHIKATNKPVGSSHLGELKLSAAEAEKVAQDIATGLLEVSDIQNLSADEKTVVKEKLKQIFHNSTLSEAYEVIGSYLGESAKTKFVEVLAKKGDHDKIISFARSRAKEGNVAVVLRLFELTSSSVVRMALLPLLPADTLLTLLGQHKIDEYDLAKVNPALFVSTLKKASSSTLNKEKLEKIANIISAEYQGTIRSIIAQNFPENSADIPGSDAWFRKIQANQRAKNKPTYNDEVQSKQTVAKADNKSESEALRQNLSQHYDPLTSADVDEQIRAQIAGVSVSEIHRRVEENERQERQEEDFDGLNIASNQMPNWKRRGRARYNQDV